MLFLGSLQASLRPNVELWQNVLLAEGLEPKEALMRNGGLILLAYNHRRWVVPRMNACRRARVPAEHMLRALPKRDARFAEWLATRSPARTARHAAASEHVSLRACLYSSKSVRLYVRCKSVRRRAARCR